MTVNTANTSKKPMVVSVLCQTLKLLCCSLYDRWVRIAQAKCLFQADCNDLQ